MENKQPNYCRIMSAASLQIGKLQDIKDRVRLLRFLLESEQANLSRVNMNAASEIMASTNVSIGQPGAVPGEVNN